MSHLPALAGITHEKIVLDLPFELAAARFSKEPGTVLLLSGSDQDCARYHILATMPWLSVTGKGDRMRVSTGSRSWEVTSQPFDLLQDLLSMYRISSAAPELPVSGGLFGYFSYDLKDRIETLPKTCMDDGLPDLALYAPSVLLVQDRQTGDTFLSLPTLSGEGAVDTQTIRDLFFRTLDQPWSDAGFRVDERGLVSSFTKPEYIRSVERIIDYLREGDIYQANLSQRFETGFNGDGYGLFLELFRRNPAAFFSYIHAGDHVVVSTSPERFIQLDGDRIETRPIKGTLARGADPESDRRNGETLVNSRKDDAELTMIVDLMRNDLSRVAVHDSVVVTEHKRLEPYDNVFHLVSVVEGQMQEDKTAVDLIRATFPGGSITGCPKIRSMEIIDELEPVCRHVYTGSIGYLSFHGTMDLSIAIRTATIQDNRLVFSVGGGIVYDSDPEKEYQETLDKGKTLMDTLVEASSGVIAPPLKAWVNGKLTDQDRAGVPAFGFGFQYGAGLFETIRVEKGMPFFLDAHISRMERSWEQLFNTRLPQITWEAVVDLLVRENRLDTGIAAVKLIAAQGDMPGKVTLSAFIRPYVHRLASLGKDGLDLVVFPESRHSFLADHKTLNYLFYERAGAFARENGADEALILNPDQSVSETNTCNLFALDRDCLILPRSAHVLPGVTLDILAGKLADQGVTISQPAMPWEELAGLPNVMATNSLMGVVKVCSINGRAIAHEDGVCRSLNRMLSFGEQRWTTL